MADQAALVPVTVPCDCPEQSRHPDGDTIFLPPELGLDAGIEVQAAFEVAQSAQERLAGMYRVLFEHQIADWTKVDETGSKIPVTSATVRQHLPWQKGGNAVAVKMQELYGEAMLAPFVHLTNAFRQASGSQKTKSSSPAGRTGKGSNSPTPSGRRKPRAH